MSAVETEQAITPKVPIWRTVKATYRETFGNLGAFLTAATVPFVISLGLVLYFPPTPQSIAQQILISGLSLVPIALFGIAWYRFLLNKTKETRPGLVSWPDRGYLRYLGYLALLTLLTLPQMLTNRFAPGVTSPLVTGAANLVFFIAFAYLGARLSFVFPSIALEQPTSLAASWRVSRGNGWRIVFASIFAAMPAFIPVGIAGAILYPIPIDQTTVDSLGQSTPLLILAGISQVCSYVYYALGVGIIVEAFSVLTGWRSDNREILERFD